MKKSTQITFPFQELNESGDNPGVGVRIKSLKKAANQAAKDEQPESKPEQAALPESNLFNTGSGPQVTEPTKATEAVTSAEPIKTTEVVAETVAEEVEAKEATDVTKSTEFLATTAAAELELPPAATKATITTNASNAANATNAANAIELPEVPIITDTAENSGQLSDPQQPQVHNPANAPDKKASSQQSSQDAGDIVLPVTPLVSSTPHLQTPETNPGFQDSPDAETDIEENKEGSIEIKEDDTQNNDGDVDIPVFRGLSGSTNLTEPGIKPNRQQGNDFDGYEDDSVRFDDNFDRKDHNTLRNEAVSINQPDEPVINEDGKDIEGDNQEQDPSIKTTEKITKSTRGRKSLKTIDEGVELINIPPDEILFQKQYYAIGEVAEMFHVNQSLLRFWETEFDIIQPRKNRKGDRHFRPVDIKNLLLIHDLLRRRKLTIEGAKDFLKKNKRSPERFAMIQSLQKIKGFILEIKATL